MAVITKETETVFGVITKADIKTYIPFWDSLFLPNCYLEESKRGSGRYLAQVGSGDQTREVKFNHSALLSGWPGIPKERSLVWIASTKVKFLGFTVPFLSRDRLVT